MMILSIPQNQGPFLFDICDNIMMLLAIISFYPAATFADFKPMVLETHRVPWTPILTKA